MPRLEVFNDKGDWGRRGPGESKVQWLVDAIKKLPEGDFLAVWPTQAELKRETIGELRSRHVQAARWHFRAGGPDSRKLVSELYTNGRDEGYRVKWVHRGKRLKSITA